VVVVALLERTLIKRTKSELEASCNYLRFALTNDIYKKTSLNNNNKHITAAFPCSTYVSNSKNNSAYN